MKKKVDDKKTIDLISRKIQCGGIKFTQDLCNHAKAYIHLKDYRNTTLAILIFSSVLKAMLRVKNTYSLVYLGALQFSVIYFHVNSIRAKEYLITKYCLSPFEIDEYIRVYATVQELI